MTGFCSTHQHFKKGCLQCETAPESFRETPPPVSSAELDGYAATKHRKTRGNKKPYKIEWRMKHGWSQFSWAREWTIWRRYETEEARNEALRTLTEKDKKRREFRAA